MREEFKQLSVAEFFKRNRQVTGFMNPTRAVYQTVKELIENAFDATETYGILPHIRLEISHFDKSRSFLEISCEDNGIGILPSYIPRAFGKVLFGSKFVLRQTRGIFGLGVKMAVLYGQITTGYPVEVITSPINSDYTYRYLIKVNIEKNEPIVIKRERRKNQNGHGTKVKLIIEGNWGKAKSKVLEYIRRTAVICPYSSFNVKYPDENGAKRLVIKRRSDKLPLQPKKAFPHPYGIDVETLKSMIRKEKSDINLISFLVKRFSGVGLKTAEEFLTANKFNPRKKIRELKEKEIVEIVHAMKKWKWRPPPASCLSPVGVENIEIGLKSMFKAEIAYATTRKPSSYSGHPFIVEVGIAYGGKIPLMEKPLLLRFANKIPLIYDEGVDVATAVVNDIDWRSYRIKFPAPLVVLTHVCSTKIPFHTLGKEAIADIPEIESEIRLAIQEVARKIRLYISKKEAREAVAKKKVEVSKYFPVIASSVSSVLPQTDPQYLVSLMMKNFRSRLKSEEESYEQREN